MLADQSWWSIDRRADAESQFDSIVVAAFFDDMDIGKVNSKIRRDGIISLPTPEEGYARVMLLGSTGAGKTTLLRQLIGSDHKTDRFPSTSTAKTTTADIEIITAEGPFEAIVSFMTEHQIRCAVDECLEEACASVVRGQDDAGVAGTLLEHREQRFRLSYVLGGWQQEQPGQGDDDQYDMDYGYGDDASEGDYLGNNEVVSGFEVEGNNERLRRYVARIREVASSVQEQMAPEHGAFQDGVKNASQRQAWLEEFFNNLYEHQGFGQLSLDIIDAIEERFGFIEAGAFERRGSGWPTLWYYEEGDRDTFLHQVRWFTSNHDQQFGRLLTPLVDGIRVRGPFQPKSIVLQSDDRKLVLLDGEGLGHSAREAMSISTKVTERFTEADMILLVDNAQSPMQAAPLELLRAVGNSGHGHKLAVVFTHFDQVKGDNLRTYAQKRDHVRASIGNAIGSLRDSLGASVTEILEQRLTNSDFYLGALNRATASVPSRDIRDMQQLLERMQQSAEVPEPIDAAPSYNIIRLELALRDATDGFKNPWRGRLGIGYHEGISKEHWGRVKALCRRIANRWDNEYSELRPVADLVRQLQGSISGWLDNPAGWTRDPEKESKRQAVINTIRGKVYVRVHSLAERRLITAHISNWQAAYAFSGTGSSYRRADQIAQICDAAAPSVTSVMDTVSEGFLNEVIMIVKEAVEEVGGSVLGIGERRDSGVS